MIFVVLLIISVLIGVVILTCSHLKKRYTSFVLKNSVLLAKIREINDKCKFFEHIDYNQTYTYDNKIFFDSISCWDYLVYQLQFISGKVITQINKEKQNVGLYSEYKNEIAKISEYGRFLKDTGRLKHEKLVAAEERLAKMFVLAKPHTDFSIAITLYCSKINGQKYLIKTEAFSADQIISIIDRLKNRSGVFYNDRAIWDSICRVERGKVSNKMRFSIYQRDGYRCRKCGATQRQAQLEVDHIIPIAKGGKTVYGNLQTLCHRCNVEKGDSIDVRSNR